MWNDFSKRVFRAIIQSKDIWCIWIILQENLFLKYYLKQLGSRDFEEKRNYPGWAKILERSQFAAQNKKLEILQIWTF